MNTQLTGRLAALLLAAAMTIALPGCGGGNVRDGVITATPDRDEPVLLTVTNVERVPTTVELLGDLTYEDLPPDQRGDYLVITVRFTNPDDGWTWSHLGEFAVSWDNEWIWAEMSPGSFDQPLLIEAGQSVEYTYEFKLAGAEVSAVQSPEDVLFYYKEEPGALWAESFASAKRSATAVVPLSVVWTGGFVRE